FRGRALQRPPPRGAGSSPAAPHVADRGDDRGKDMTNSLERIFEGIIDVLHSRVIPKIHDESARSQAYGALDMLRNLKPRVGWAVGPLRAAVVEELPPCAPTAALPENAKPAPPSAPAERPSTSGLPAAELEPLRDRLDEYLCGVLRWIAAHRETLPSTNASE